MGSLDNAKLFLIYFGTIRNRKENCVLIPIEEYIKY